MGEFSIFDYLFPDSVGGKEKFSSVGVFLSSVLPVIYFVAGLLFLAAIIISGFRIMWGGEKSLADSKKMLMNSVIGLVIVAAAAVITAIVARAFGLGAEFEGLGL